jgi:ZIP family zinc transporter
LQNASFFGAMHERIAFEFAAKTTFFVVVEELIPESHHAGNVDLATLSLMLGFTLMMVLDVGLG